MALEWACKQNLEDGDLANPATSVSYSIILLSMKLFVESKNKVMQGTNFGQNIYKNNEQWRHLEIFTHIENPTFQKNSEFGNTLINESLILGKFQKKFSQPSTDN